MTTNIKELSEKLSELYGVDANSEYREINFKTTAVGKWLAEDSGRISDLADENGLTVVIGNDSAIASKDNEFIIEKFYSHPTKSAAARMARVRCLIVIKESE